MKTLVISRHCNFSKISANKSRPNWFSRENCFNNLLNTFKNDCEINVVFDGSSENHFIKNYNVKKIEVGAGSGARSFTMSLDYAIDNTNDDDIIYFVEDDYLHKPDSFKVILEGIQLNENGYISLYDHPDKYTQMYQGLQSTILSGKYCHWRTTPSTTDTFAIKRKTLVKCLPIMKEFSNHEIGYSLDHQRCLKLWDNKIPLITSIPGFSTHCEPNLLSPTIYWNKL